MATPNLTLALTLCKAMIWGNPVGIMDRNLELITQNSLDSSFNPTFRLYKEPVSKILYLVVNPVAHDSNRFITPNSVDEITINNTRLHVNFYKSALYVYLMASTYVIRENLPIVITGYLIGGSIATSLDFIFRTQTSVETLLVTFSAIPALSNYTLDDSHIYGIYQEHDFTHLLSAPIILNTLQQDNEMTMFLTPLALKSYFMKFIYKAKLDAIDSVVLEFGVWIEDNIYTFMRHAYFLFMNPKEAITYPPGRVFVIKGNTTRPIEDYLLDQKDYPKVLTVHEDSFYAINVMNISDSLEYIDH